MVRSSIDLSSTNATQMIIPQAEVSGTGVHIRVNGDNENANLVEVTFSCPAIATMSGFTIAVSSSTSNLNVWSSNQKGTAILNGAGRGNLTLDGSGNATVWVEALAQGGNDLNFLFQSGGTTSSGTAGTLHFVNYDSFTEDFSGETFNGGAAAAQAESTFNVAQKLYLEGYNIAYYDVHTINTSTGQPAYGELKNQIQKSSVKSVGVFGYSHGGGQTYSICSYLNRRASETLK
jgi:hypothetical protein